MLLVGLSPSLRLHTLLSPAEQLSQPTSLPPFSVLDSAQVIFFHLLFIKPNRLISLN